MARVLKSVFAPHLNRHVKFGRKRPVARGPHLRLENYLKQSLPAVPPSYDYSPPALSVLKNIFGNDDLGDCVPAWGYHFVGLATGNAGDLFTATLAQVTADYSAIGGYVPGDPSTDQGCDEPTAFNYWQNHGFANGTKLLGWLAIDPANKAEVMAAAYLFENDTFGVELPDAWITPFPSADGFAWDVAGDPDPENGHCFGSTGYGPSGLQIDTWGLSGTITYPAIAKYCAQNANGALYVLLTLDQLAKGQAKAPNGVAWTNLIADFDSLGGTVPIPAPAPTPAPLPPAPVSELVTLSQAQAWAISKLITGHVIMTRAQAELAVTSALAAHWPKS